MVISSTAILATGDVAATIEHYKQVLGFETSWTYDDPPTFGAASMGGVTLMFSLQPELAAKVAGHQHWIKVDEVDQLYALHQSLGAKIVSPIEDQPWGAREYVVEDPNGYQLRFAGSPSSQAEPSKPFPADVRIERRLPTLSEFERVVGLAFGGDRPQSDILDRTWNGVVALGPDGTAIGTLRIMHDAPGWFSIWDVAVAPEWQGFRIGESIMKEALEMVREASPGAFVFLFTFKHGFYQKLGFNLETVSMRKV